MSKPRPNRAIDTAADTRELLDRMTRIAASEEWAGEINPTQRAALAYLARANRFSRKPSQVADYLSATRGTVSQTLKALARKGLIEEQRSQSDKRSISYGLTSHGHTALNFTTAVDAALEQLSDTEIDDLSANLRKVIKSVLTARGGRSFGICNTCQFHQQTNTGAYCTLLDEDLHDGETTEICHEFAERRAANG